ncbi:ABC transporter permease [uncultured Spirosoma sp.]|uniref:ABC transporter permease n=1 Tax=uncultured Spirosoma sp. TaxID=278208 RepID=UPI002584D02B|nr:ABC transporter permease [uncultured Spirosoma sp.]
MLTNYLKIAWRSLVRNRLLSSINVVGLSLGMTCCILVGLWVQEEYSVNDFYPDLNRLYFVRLTDSTNTGEVTPGALEQAMTQTAPGIEATTRFTVWSNDFLLRAGNRSTKKVGNYVTSGFFSLFNYSVLQGDPQAAIQQPNAIVVTRTIAQTLFGTTQAVGRTLQLNNEKFFRVGAVIEDIPQNSTVRFDWMVNLKATDADWNSYMFLTYVKLKQNVSQAQAESSLHTLVSRYVPKAKEYPVLQPLSDVYLYGNYTNGQPSGGRISYVRTFSLIAVLILLISCINFMNLATARSTLRTKEIGVRKVVGATRLSLIGQFISESLVLSMVSALLAVGLTALLLPTVSSLIDKPLSVNFLAYRFWLGLSLLVFLTGLLAGSYPSLVLSASKPVEAINRVLLRQSAGVSFRRILVVFQFSLSLFLIIGMLVIGQQMHYVLTKQLGLDRQHVVCVPVEGEAYKNVLAIQKELQRHSAINAVSSSGELPIHIGSTGAPDWPGRVPDAPNTVSAMKVGPNFLRTMGVQLLAGRDFVAGDTMNYLVNESAARMMNLKEPVGTEITFQRGKGHIVGLLKDFHLNSLHEPIRPLILSYYPKWTNFFLIKTQPGQTQEALLATERIIHQFNPGYPFVYRFLDQEYETLYRSETLANTLVRYFGILAIFIACLGLFGLATFTANQRTKEIGVRKVLGASVASIVALLSRDFLKLVLIAIVLASPLAYYAMNQWLQGFAYRVDIRWWVFALAGLLAIGIALLTVSFQSIKAALVNPVKSLRSE